MAKRKDYLPAMAIAIALRPANNLTPPGYRHQGFPLLSHEKTPPKQELGGG